MDTREKRNAGYLHDTSSGTVNITHGGSAPSSNTGFFGGGFTNTGGYGKKRRRRRQRARARARAEAQARAQALALAQAKAQAEREAQAAAEANARAVAHEQARIRQAHRETVEALARSFEPMREALLQRYVQDSSALSNALGQPTELGTDRDIATHEKQQILNAILDEKARINYLIANKTDQLRVSNLKHAQEVDKQSIQSGEQYKDYLLSGSQGDAQRAQQLHDAWRDSLSEHYQNKLLAESISMLTSTSEQLATRYAQINFTPPPDVTTASAQASVDSPAQQAAKLAKLWSMASAPSAPNAASSRENGTLRDTASRIAKEQLTRAVMRRLGRNLPALLATYSSETGDAGRPSMVVGTPVSQLNLPKGLDLGFIAAHNGTLDLTHRLALQDSSEGPVAQWVEADGVVVGSKVRVRNFTYNAQNNTYEFVRDGDSTPTLIWTPISRPADSSTTSLGQVPVSPDASGLPITDVETQVDIYPEVDRNNPDDYILLSPPGSGLPDSYVLFKDPRSVPGIANGYGKPVSGTWLGENSRGEGAPVPSHIADELRGERFSHFDYHRRAMWKAVANDRELSKQFTARNLARMKQGSAAFTPANGKVGGRDSLEIHHKHEVAKGGEVYDMDNWLIMTPADHIQHHKDQRND
jgi:hypothetical protein